jgi:hypothetical protein
MKLKTILKNNNMKKNIENIEILSEKNVVKFHIECDCGFTQTYFAKEVLNFFKENDIVKDYEVDTYKCEVHGEIDLIHWYDKGLDTEKISIEELTIYEFVDENYDLFEYFLNQRFNN